MNIRIFDDAAADVRVGRRIRRDVKKRGRSIDSVIDQYLTTVKPMHELYVEPSKKNAHIIVPEGGKNLIALEMIINRIQRHIDASADGPRNANGPGCPPGKPGLFMLQIPPET